MTAKFKEGSLRHIIEAEREIYFCLLEMEINPEQFDGLLLEKARLLLMDWQDFRRQVQNWPCVQYGE